MSDESKDSIVVRYNLALLEDIAIHLYNASAQLAFIGGFAHESYPKFDTLEHENAYTFIKENTLKLVGTIIKNWPDLLPE